MSAILTLKDVQEITDAFDGFVTVEQSNLPQYYKDIFPKRCQCGGEVIMTKDTEVQNGYTQLQCCNPDCWVKMAYRFAYFCKQLGFKGLGSSGALTLYANVHQQFKYPTFLSVFDLPLSEVSKYCGDAYGDKFEDVRHTLKTSTFQFQEAIAALGIPDVGKGSRLFDVIKSPVALLDFVLKKQLNELCDAAGIYAPKSRYFLEMHKYDIATLMVDIMPNIRSTPNHEVYVAITGSVRVNGQSLTRAQFISMCEYLRDKNGNPAYKIVETKAASKLDYVIADSPSSSSKYALGKKLDKLITAQEFYDLLRRPLEEPCEKSGTVEDSAGEAQIVNDES